MASDRGDIFADEDLDLAKFKPKAADLPPRPGPEVLAQAGGDKFVSREAVAPAPKARKTAEPKTPEKAERKWRYRTGRDQQFNTRASQATVQGYAALAERLNCPIAEVIERALQALQREIDAS